MKLLWVGAVLPGMNEILNAKGSKWSTGYNGYALLKKKWGGVVAAFAMSQKFTVEGEGFFHYRFHEPNRRRDPSNFSSGGIKIIEDALQKAGVLSGDGWKQVRGISYDWVHDKTCPGVSLIVSHERLADVTGKEWELWPSSLKERFLKEQDPKAAG
jgi:hypothetical protein